MRTLHATLLLATLSLACSRATVSGTEETGTSSGTGSGGGDNSSSTSSTSSGGGATTTSGPSSDGGTGGDGGDATTGEDTGGGAFIQEPDGGSGDGIECDIWAGDCPEGQKCMPWANDGGTSWNATKCAPLDPNPKDVGEPCMVEGNGVSGIDNCGPRAMCWNVDPETNEGHCIAFCVGSASTPTCLQHCSICSIYNNGILPLCFPSCDPVAQDCPDEGACVATSDGFACMMANPGEGPYGTPCSYGSDCDPGLFCAAADRVPACSGAPGCCTRLCYADAPDHGCPDAHLGVECLPELEGSYDPSCVPGELGGCLLPP